MSKKVFVLEPYLDLLGGSERMAFEVAKGLAGAGWEIHVGYERDGIWRERYQSFAVGFHPIRLPVLTIRRPWEMVTTVRKLHRLLKKLGIRSIFTSYNGHLLLAGLLERFCGIRSCFHLGLMGAVANTVSGRWAVRQISAGVAPSAQTAESWRRIGWPGGTIHVVPNWIDWEEYSELPTKEEARKKLGIWDMGDGRESGKRKAETVKKLKVVAYVGRLVREKGIEVLLEAWKEVEVQMPEAVLLVAGDGEPKYEAKLKKMAGTRVKFLGRVEDPRKVYVASDLVVVPSLWDEPFGLVPLEAVACGALFLVSNRGFLPQIVSEAGQELVHPAGNFQALGSQIVSWLKKNEKTPHENLRKFIMKRFDADSGVRAYQSLLREK